MAGECDCVRAGEDACSFFAVVLVACAVVVDAFGSVWVAMPNAAAMSTASAAIAAAMIVLVLMFMAVSLPSGRFVLSLQIVSC